MSNLTDLYPTVADLDARARRLQWEKIIYGFTPEREAEGAALIKERNARTYRA